MSEESENIQEPAAEPKIFDLAQPLYQGMPCSPNQPGFRMALTRRHGDYRRSDGTSGSSELIVMGGHVGTHMDALSHASADGLLHGGIDAYEAQRGGRFSSHGIEGVAPLMGRGVLLDVAAWQGVDVLSADFSIGARELVATAEHFEVDVAGAKFILVRTGWANYFDTPDQYIGGDTGAPGVVTDGAEWIAELGVAATGSDTIPYERVSPSQPGVSHRLMPVHRVLLVESGIHIMEVMNLEPLSEVSVYEFTLLVAPLRIVGGTGGPVRPVAWV